MIYLDYNATTPVAHSAVEAMLPYLSEKFGNPSSAHSAGSETRAAIDAARASVAKMLGAFPDEIIFTSGGTESDNWSIIGACEASPEKRHIITTKVEHEAVRRVVSKLEAGGYRVTWLDVDSGGKLDLGQLEASISDDTAVVSMMAANNETGVVFPINEAAEMVRSLSGALFHVDGVNAAGKMAFDLTNSNIDLLSISAHKFYGPKGIGASYIRRGVELPSSMIGGGQESGRRAGTPAVHQIVGLGAAAEIAADLSSLERIAELRDKLENTVLTTIADSSVNGSTDAGMRLCNTTNISFENLNGGMIMHLLDEAGICVSTGSACHTQDHSASVVLQAMNIPYSRAMGSIRFSLGRQTSDAEINEVLYVLPDVIRKLRKASDASA